MKQNKRGKGKYLVVGKIRVVQTLKSKESRRLGDSGTKKSCNYFSYVKICVKFTRKSEKARFRSNTKSQVVRYLQVKSEPLDHNHILGELFEFYYLGFHIGR